MVSNALGLREPRHIVADVSRWVEEEGCLLSKYEICDVKDCKVRFTKYDANVSALGSAAMAILQNVPAGRQNTWCLPLTGG